MRTPGSSCSSKVIQDMSGVTCAWLAWLGMAGCLSVMQMDNATVSLPATFLYSKADTFELHAPVDLRHTAYDKQLLAVALRYHTATNGTTGRTGARDTDLQ